MSTATADKKGQLQTAFQVKAIESKDGKHIVRGIASTWNKDLGNDIIERGAFTRTLSHWRTKRDEKPIPFLDQHRTDSVTRIIGKMIEAAETTDGLEVAFEVATHQHALDVFSLIQAGMVTGLSIGYEAIKFEFLKEDNKPAWDLTRVISELKLFEISVVVWPMNDEARIDTGSVKSLIEASKTRELSSDELRVLKELAIDINALLTKGPAAPAENTPPAATPPSGLATVEQVAAAQHTIARLKLRTPHLRVRETARRGDQPSQLHS